MEGRAFFSKSQVDRLTDNYPTEAAKIQMPVIQLLVKIESIAGGFSEPYCIVHVVARKENSHTYRH